MGIKKAVPEPTSKDLSLVSIGFDAWYEHEEGLTPRPEIVEDYRQQTLTLIRLANHYHDELLRLRTDAGDEEIEDLLDSIPAPELNEKWVKLTGENECLRNDLRSAREEIKRWEKRAEWIGSCYKDDVNGKSLVVFDGTKSATYPDDAKTIAKMIDNAMTEGCDLSEGLLTTKQQIQSLQSQIATLAAERDEAKSGNDFLRQEIEDWKEASRRAEAERDEARKGENTQCTIRYMLQDELDAAKAELSALKAGRVVETDGVNGLNSEKGVGC